MEGSDLTVCLVFYHSARNNNQNANKSSSLPVDFYFKLLKQSGIKISVKGNGGFRRPVLTVYPVKMISSTEPKAHKVSL